MTRKIIIAVASTTLSIVLPLFLLAYVQLPSGHILPKEFWGKYMFRVCVLIGIAGIH